MTAAPRVLGLVMARDEWPLLALAVTHVLQRHADHVVVLDHASTDQTAEGVEDLQRRFPGRLTALRLDDPAYLQEATTSVLLEAAGADDYDWVYVFDADEFLLTAPGSSLRDVLAGVDPTVPVVRYEVHNWVAPSDFDEGDLAAYGSLTLRALPDPTRGPADVGDLATAIEEGTVNFFDVPFPTKVVFRGGSVTWLSGGGHLAREPQGLQELEVPPSTLRAAHVPLLSERRLALKVAQGRALAEAGFPPEHGWQNQMLHRIEIAGALVGFWHSHSVAPPEGRGGDDRARPALVEDRALVEALGPAVGALGDPHVPGADPAPMTGDVPLAAAVRVVRRLQAASEAAAADLSHTRAERDRVLIGHHGLVEHLENVVADRERIVGDQERLRAENEVLRGTAVNRWRRLRRVIAQRDALKAERDDLKAERDAQRAERDGAVGRPGLRQRLGL